MADRDSTPQITEVGTIAVPVSDQDRSVEFYVEKRGFQKRMDVPMSGSDRWIEVAPANGATTIALVRPGEELSPGIDTGIRLMTSNADADRSTLKAAGVDVDDLMRWGGG